MQLAQPSTRKLLPLKLPGGLRSLPPSFSPSLPLSLLPFPAPPAPSLLSSLPAPSPCRPARPAFSLPPTASVSLSPLTAQE